MTNSWATSSRLLAPTIHRCLFCGCYRDDLGHYSGCKTLWDILCCAARLDPVPWDLSPLHRVGILEPDLRKLLLVACAFRVHHAVKLQHLEIAISARTPPGDPLPLYELILQLAVFHLKELHDHSGINF